MLFIATRHYLINLAVKVDLASIKSREILIDRRIKVILLAFITTFIVGWLGTSFGHDYLNFPQLGTILSVATMGGFIMAAIRKNYNE